MAPPPDATKDAAAAVPAGDFSDLRLALGVWSVSSWNDWKSANFVDFFRTLPDRDIPDAPGALLSEEEESIPEFGSVGPNVSSVCLLEQVNIFFFSKVAPVRLASVELAVTDGQLGSKQLCQNN